MSLNALNLNALYPGLDEAEFVCEDKDAYATRLACLLPNFPTSVVLQWFYDHPRCIETYAGLDYLSLRFELVTLPAIFLDAACFAGNETVLQFSDYMQSAVGRSPRSARLLEYTRRNFTWPEPPVIADNRNGRFPPLPGFSWRVPYDIIEGHHRLAALYALRLTAREGHKAWLVSSASS